jgi:hypothetical protein
MQREKRRVQKNFTAGTGPGLSGLVGSWLCVNTIEYMEGCMKGGVDNCRTINVGRLHSALLLLLLTTSV